MKKWRRRWYMHHGVVVEGYKKGIRGQLGTYTSQDPALW